MIVRAIALKNASVTGTACACQGAGSTAASTGSNYSEAGTVVDFGGRARDLVLYAGLQILSSGLNGLRAFLQANSSSGFGSLNLGTDLVAFTSRACRDAQLQRIPWNCASATSTNRGFYRAAYTQTCTDTNKWLLAMDLDVQRP